MTRVTLNLLLIRQLTGHGRIQRQMQGTAHLICESRKELSASSQTGRTLRSVVESTKLLGLTISNDLTRNVHVSEVRKYLLKQLYFLIQLKRANVSEFDLSRFYTACIRSVIDYAAPVFNHALPKYLLNELERIQKRALRFIYPYTEYHHALSRLGLPTIAEHHDHICQPTFKSIVSRRQPA